MTELQVTINNLRKACIAAVDILEKTQKEKETPPQHEWEHGDVYKSSTGCIMIYLKFSYGRPRTVCVVGGCGGLVEHKNFKGALRDAEFLFNIKEKL